MSEWQIHDGSGYPAQRGVRVEYLCRNGEIGQTILQNRQSSPDGYDEKAWVRSVWHWAHQQAFYWYAEAATEDIIAYRLHDNGEQAKREARIASLRKMAQPNDYDVRPVKAPQRKRVKQ